MKPAPFEYARPDSVDEAVALLAEHGPDAKVLAGGQSLVPLLNFRLSRPAVLVDIARIPGLDRVSVGDDGIRIGALARQRRVERDARVRAACPLLPVMLGHVGHLQVRTRGTILGSLAHADPAAELPAAAVLLGGRLVVDGPAGRREIEAEDFFIGPFSTVLAPDELLVEVVFPVAGVQRTAFAEVARRHGDFAIAGVAAAAMADGIRLAALGVAWTPIRLRAAEAAANEGVLDDARIGAAAAAARAEVDPTDDIHADRAYRVDLIGVLVTRVLEDLRR